MCSNDCGSIDASAPGSNREPGAVGRRRKKADRIADHIKRWIMLQGLNAGDRLPPEEELMRRLQVSRGTMREALRSLEVQGLIEQRSGRGGGPRVVAVTDEVAIELLGNYFYSRNLSISNIYSVRKVLEPEMAAQVVGRLSDEQFDLLERSVNFCSCEVAHPSVRHEQRMSELDFHDILTDACPNEYLGFTCKTMNHLLKNLAVCRSIYSGEVKDLAAGARNYHALLLDAYRNEDAEKVREYMTSHMLEAETYMVRHEAIVQQKFIMREDLLDAVSF